MQTVKADLYSMTSLEEIEALKDHPIARQRINQPILDAAIKDYYVRFHRKHICNHSWQPLDVDRQFGSEYITAKGNPRLTESEYVRQHGLLLAWGPSTCHDCQESFFILGDSEFIESLTSIKTATPPPECTAEIPATVSRFDD